MKLSDGEKLILVMLSEIHQELGIQNGVDAQLVKDAIHEGNLWSLDWTFTGIFHGSEPSEEMLHTTVDVMEMWGCIERDYAKLSPEDKAWVDNEAAPFGNPTFSGFDGNEEAFCVGIARFLIEKLDRFQEFKGRELNAHMPTLAAHQRMLGVFKQIRASQGYGALTSAEIAEVLKARKYPERRGAHAN